MQATATDIYTRYQSNHSAKQERSIDPNSGQITVSGNRRLFVQLGANDGAHIYYTATANNTHRDGDITGTEAARLFTLIAGLVFHLNDHLQAKNDARWQRIYHYAARWFDALDQNGNVVQMSLHSYPCHYCGLILPEDSIQVDHRQPQAGASGLAVAKMLHSVRLTGLTLSAGAATGVKNQQAIRIARNQGNLNPVPVKAWPRNTPWQQHNVNQAKTDKYTLDPEGVTFLTLAVMTHGANYFESACVNSFLNLVPACPLCNRSKTNIAHAHR